MTVHASPGPCGAPDAPAADVYTIPVFTQAAEWLREARAQAAGALVELGVDAETIYKVTVVVSELLTNSCTHTDSKFAELELSRTPEGIHLKIQDDGSPHKPGAVPVVLPLSEETEGGRGLFIVDALTSRWKHVRLLSGGSVYCADFDLSPTAKVAA